MKELSLFSGMGGGLLCSVLLKFKTLGYVENEKACQKVIKQRINDGFLDAAPIFGDIEAFIREGYAQSYKGMVDVISAGTPCQPFSVAGKKLGKEDPRNLWPATLRVIKIVKPAWVFLENVPGLIIPGGYFETILQGLAESGYNAAWKVLSASECGASQQRKRLWIVASPTGMYEGSGYSCSYAR